MARLQRYQYSEELNGNSPRVEYVPGFKKPLYDYQASTVYQALEYIKTRYKYVEHHEGDVAISDKQALMTNSIYIAEPYGSGKSIIILAIFCCIGDIIPNYQLCNGFAVDRAYCGYKKFHTEVYREYSGILRSKVIFVGSNVMIQWENVIKEFTNMTYIAIGDLKSLREFYESYRKNKSLPYDIILLRNGAITQSFFIDGDKTDYCKHQLIEIFGKITKGKAFQLVAYDDFDTIKVHNNTNTLNSLFNIFASATCKCVYRSKPKRYFESLKDMIREIRGQKIVDAADDRALIRNFAIASEKNYIKQSMNLPKFLVFKCNYKNPDERYMQLIGAIDTVDANEILQALNGDAPVTAAALAGINVDPEPGSIFQRLLDNQWNIYQKSQRILRLVNVLSELSGGLKQHPRGNHPYSELDAVEKEILSRANSNTIPTVANTKHILQYNSAALQEFLVQIKQDNEVELARASASIRRVKDNLREGSCAVCCLDFADNSRDVVILKCCSMVICGQCLEKGCRLRKTPHANGGCDITGKCPNPYCAKVIDILKHIIYVDKTLDIQKVIDSTGVDEPAEEKKPAKKPVVQKKEDKSADSARPSGKLNEKNPKLCAVYDIIRGSEPENTQPADHANIVNIVRGEEFKQADVKFRKILLFASFDETLDNLTAFFAKHNIVHLQLRGTFQEKYKILQQFRDIQSDAVMIAKSRENCAGLDGMQYFVTDLIYYHDMEREVMGQVAGRLQRMGRSFSFKVYFLLYDNEVARIGL